MQKQKKNFRYRLVYLKCLKRYKKNSKIIYERVFEEQEKTKISDILNSNERKLCKISEEK